MLRTLVNVSPTQEFRALDDMFERLFGNPSATQSQASTLAVDILERDNNLLVKAAVPGVDPNELEIQIENNVLTIRGEAKHEATTENDKIYRREVSYGAFSRSIRLPEGLNIEGVDAEFKNGIVTITIPRVPEEKPKSLKVNVRQAGQGSHKAEKLIGPSTSKTPEAAKA